MWDNKRCFFRRELQRMIKRNTKHSPWVYFPFLLFLKPLMPPELIAGIEDEQFYVDNVFENITSFDRKLDEPVASNVRLKKNIRKILQGIEISSGDEEETEENDEQDNEDEDIKDDEDLAPVEKIEPMRITREPISKMTLTKLQHTDYRFFQTFLPTLQTMTSQERLQKRIEVMQLLGRQSKGIFLSIQLL